MAAGQGAGDAGADGDEGEPVPVTTFPNISLPLRIRALEESFVIDDAAGMLIGD